MGAIQNAVDSLITTATSMSYNNAMRRVANKQNQNAEQIKSLLEEQAQWEASPAKVKYNTGLATLTANKPEDIPSNLLTYDKATYVANENWKEHEQARAQNAPYRFQDDLAAALENDSYATAEQVAAQSMQQQATTAATQENNVKNMYEQLKDGKLHTFTRTDSGNTWLKSAEDIEAAGGDQRQADIRREILAEEFDIGGGRVVNKEAIRDNPEALAAFERGKAGKATANDIRTILKVALKGEDEIAKQNEEDEEHYDEYIRQMTEEDKSDVFYKALHQEEEKPAEEPKEEPKLTDAQKRIKENNEALAKYGYTEEMAKRQDELRLSNNVGEEWHELEKRRFQAALKLREEKENSPKEPEVATTEPKEETENKSKYEEQVNKAKKYIDNLKNNKPIIDNPTRDWQYLWNLTLSIISKADKNKLINSLETVIADPNEDTLNNVSILAKKLVDKYIKKEAPLDTIKLMSATGADDFIRHPGRELEDGGVVFASTERVSDTRGDDWRFTGRESAATNFQGINPATYEEYEASGADQFMDYDDYVQMKKEDSIKHKVNNEIEQLEKNEKYYEEHDYSNMTLDEFIAKQIIKPYVNPKTKSGKDKSEEKIKQEERNLLQARLEYYRSNQEQHNHKYDEYIADKEKYKEKLWNEYMERIKMY